MTESRSLYCFRRPHWSGEPLPIFVSPNHGVNYSRGYLPSCNSLCH